jgi:hypothetical protein
MYSASSTITSAPTYPASVSRRVWWQGNSDVILQCCAGVEDVDDDGSMSLNASGIVDMQEEGLLARREARSRRAGEDHESRVYARDKTTRNSHHTIIEMKVPHEDFESEASQRAPDTIYVAQVSRPEDDKYDNPDDPMYHEDDVASEVSLDFGLNFIKGKVIIPIKKVKRTSKSNGKETPKVEPTLKNDKEVVRTVEKNDHESEEDWAPSSERMMRAPPAKPKKTYSSDKKKTQRKVDSCHSRQKEFFGTRNGVEITENFKTSEGVNDLCGQGTEKGSIVTDKQPLTARLESNTEVSKTTNVDSTVTISNPNQGTKLDVCNQGSKEIKQTETAKEMSGTPEIVHPESSNEIRSLQPVSAPVEVSVVSVAPVTDLEIAVKDSHELKSSLSSGAVRNTPQEGDTTYQISSSSLKDEQSETVSLLWPSPFKRRRRKVISSPPPVLIEKQGFLRSESWEEREFDRLTISDARFIPDISWRELKLHPHPPSETQERKNVNKSILTCEEIPDAPFVEDAIEVEASQFMEVRDACLIPDISQRELNLHPHPPSETSELKHADESISECAEISDAPLVKDAIEVEASRAMEVRDPVEYVRHRLPVDDDSDSEDSYFGDKYSKGPTLLSPRDAYTRARKMAKKFGGFVEPLPEDHAPTDKYGDAKVGFHGDFESQEEIEMKAKEAVRNEPLRGKMEWKKKIIHENEPSSTRTFKEKVSKIRQVIRSSGPKSRELQPVNPGSLLL